MDSLSFQGFVLDPSKCSKLSMEEKRELVYEVSEWSQGSPELLQSWSRQEILQILCAEMGKERKYTGLSKLKVIEQLLKIVSKKRSQDDILMNLESSESGHQRCDKRRRKSDHPNRLNVAIDRNCDNNVVFCKNSACRAKLVKDGVFCKRCSCCVCYQYDDNKDPSLWLTCGSDACGMSCHVECAIKHEKPGILKDGENRGLDGSFYCVSCGEVNELLECWRKQMTVARDTRRVDILCYRIYLSQKLLAGTLQYQKLHDIVNEAMEKLEADVGLLTGLPVKRARGIVNRLSSGQEVQKLCAYAVEAVDSVLSNPTVNGIFSLLLPPFHKKQSSTILSRIIKFENVSPTSISVILGSQDQPYTDNINTHRYIMWHRKAEDKDYPTKPTCSLFAQTGTNFLLTGLTPSTQYVLKAVHFENTHELGSKEMTFHTCNDNEKSPITDSSSLSTPPSVEDEQSNIVSKQKDKEVAANTEVVDIIKNMSRNGESSEKDLYPFAPSTFAKLPMTPCKAESEKGSTLARKTRKTASKSNLDNRSEDEQDGSDHSDGQDFGYYVKVIRRLECEGHIDTGFRKKFLTWYSLRASQQEVRVVKVFVDTLMDDPASLAGQLVDTFSHVITTSTCSSTGVCLKLFH
ncbi:VIN3-like protein 2 [Bidens hawaiensis]|uniref:VIN3-like protein 2 n=1 Tax=Bidens hawaiensis TaxID=980011 RepID=UPI00404A4BBD